jgi:2-methylaconitate cis-trans-isomerase PrpF
MRGGTSKAVFLMEEDLPSDPILRERIILAIFGSPDIRQIDGLGGADSLTSKLAIIQPSKKAGIDIDYTFGAVGIDQPFVDYSANCGNISSAVGPFAIDRGLVKAKGPFATVKIFNTNTKKMILARMMVEKGRVIFDGDYQIAGVPGTGAKIELTFMDPGGAITGRLLPTGNVTDIVKLDTGEEYRITIIDAGNPTAFIQAADLGLQGTELPGPFEQNVEAKRKLEAIRIQVAERMGIPINPSIPKICFVAPPLNFRTLTGIEVKKDAIDFLGRVMAMGKMHKTFAITAGIPAAIAGVISGSVVSGVLEGPGSASRERSLIIGHPSGQMDVRVEAKTERGKINIVSCTVGRTARKIMDGKVYISNGVYE